MTKISRPAWACPSDTPLELEREISAWCQRAGRVTGTMHNREHLLAAACRIMLAAAAGFPVEPEDAEEEEVVELVIMTRDDEEDEAFDAWGGGKR